MCGKIDGEVQVRATKWKLIGSEKYWDQCGDSKADAGLVRSKSSAGSQDSEGVHTHRN